MISDMPPNYHHQSMAMIKKIAKQNTEHKQNVRERKKSVAAYKERRAHREEIENMTPQALEERAKGVIQNVWDKAAKYFGKEGEPMPEYSFNETQSNDGLLNEGEVDPVTRAILFNPKMMRKLARKPSKHFQGVTKRSEAQETVLHELAHHYQTKQLMEDATDNYAHREEAAQLLSTYLAHKLFSGPEMNAFGSTLPYGNRKAASRALAGGYGKGYWRKRQFEE